MNISTSNIDYTKSQRYVRVTNVRPDALVEFEFSIDDPRLHVELVLPFQHFQIFCKRNSAIELSHEQEVLVDLDKLKWRNGEVGKN